MAYMGGDLTGGVVCAPRENEIFLGNYVCESMNADGTFSV